MTYSALRHQTEAPERTEPDYRSMGLRVGATRRQLPQIKNDFLRSTDRGLLTTGERMVASAAIRLGV
ncbi:MAG TPA: hypothetical protein VFX20_02985 [Steroidobacteraceae bacterium]|nr:hypothetical protein [Steroidobacteraceae bacterium]